MTPLRTKQPPGSPHRLRRLRLRRAIGVLVALFGTCSATPSAAPAERMANPDDPRVNAMGINAYATLDWAHNRPFADLMRTARRFTVPEDDTIAARVDANGWPVTDAATIVFADLDRNHGTHALSFRGRARVEVRGDAELRDLAYDPATDRSTAKVVVRSPHASFLRLAFLGTRGGVRDVRLMRPTAPGAATSLPESTMFTETYLRLVRSFSVLRAMDWMATNGNGQVRWRDRVMPSYASGNRQMPGYGWQGRGVAWELVVMLANTAGKDLWINVPARADDDYVRRLALLLRDGSTVAGVRYPGLRPDLRLYVEYSNEVWNGHGDFTQSRENHAAAVAELRRPRSPLAFDGERDPWIATWRRVGLRAAQISAIFRSVFGDEQMMTRVRPIFAWQQNDGQATGSVALDFVDRWFGVVRPGNPVARPVSWFFFGGGGSAYYNPDNDDRELTLDSIWTSGTFARHAWERVLERDVMLTLAYGLRRIAYEGGPSLDGDTAIEVKRRAIRDPRMTDLIVEHHRAWSRFGGDLLVYYSDAGPDAWGFTDDALEPDSAKLRAIARLAAMPRDTATIGHVPPHAFRGGDFDLGNPGWLERGAPAVRLEHAQRGFLLFVLRVEDATTVTVELEHAFARDGARVEMRIDGVTLDAPVALTPDRDDAGRSVRVPLSTARLAPGLHGLVVRVTRGMFDVRGVDVRVH